MSFGAGILAGAIFALVKTPTPVPPLIGMVGLLSIALGEIGMNRVLNTIRRSRESGRSLFPVRGFPPSKRRKAPVHDGVAFDARKLERASGPDKARTFQAPPDEESPASGKEKSMRGNYR